MMMMMMISSMRKSFLPFLDSYSFFQIQHKNTSHAGPCAVLQALQHTFHPVVCVSPRVCLSHLAACSLGAEIMSYSSLCPHNSINITSVSQKQCHCYDTKLCRCGASHSCQSLISGKRTHPMPLFLHCLQQKSHKQNPIWQGFLK